MAFLNGTLIALAAGCAVCTWLNFGVGCRFIWELLDGDYMPFNWITVPVGIPAGYFGIEGFIGKVWAIVIVSLVSVLIIFRYISKAISKARNRLLKAQREAVAVHQAVQDTLTSARSMMDSVARHYNRQADSWWQW